MWEQVRRNLYDQKTRAKVRPPLFLARCYLWPNLEGFLLSHTSLPGFGLPTYPWASLCGLLQGASWPGRVFCVDSLGNSLEHPSSSILSTTSLAHSHPRYRQGGRHTHTHTHPDLSSLGS